LNGAEDSIVAKEIKEKENCGSDFRQAKENQKQ
jgi:hypothetical protein